MKNKEEMRDEEEGGYTMKQGHIIFAFERVGFGSV
jgi:hypothetical protein